MSEQLKNTQELFERLSNVIPSKEKRLRKTSMHIAAAIDDILKSKKLTQKWLAEKLGRKESQVSKWLSGGHNFTIKTITEIEEAIEVKIIIINYEIPVKDKLGTDANYFCYSQYIQAQSVLSILNNEYYHTVINSSDRLKRDKGYLIKG